jgi:hypothetical protein
MRVAVVEITLRTFSGNATMYGVGFSDLEKAKAEYRRVADLITARVERKNDKPATVEIVGDGNMVTAPLDDIGSVALQDYAWANAEETGVKDKYPNLFKR